MNKVINILNKIKLSILIFMLAIIVLFINSIYNLKVPLKMANSTQIKALQDNENYFNSDYWEWHTRTTTTDKAYNGNHIVINKDKSIDFYGYGVTSYKDYLYKEYSNAGEKTFKFKIDETKASYHTLDGAGFMFNAKKENDLLSGYVLLIREKDICIYRLDNVNTTKFETTANTTIQTYGKLLKSVSKVSSTIHNLIVKVSPTNVSVIDNEKEILNLNLDYSKHSGENFGLISSYLQHDCPILSKIRFFEFTIEFKDYEIPVLKTDEDKKPLEGAKFQVKNENGEVIRNGITNSEGIYIIDGLRAGIYTLEETEAPLNYAFKSNIIKFKVTDDGKVLDVNTGEEISLNVINEKLKLKITVLDKDDKTPISGSTVRLCDENGNKINGKTDKDGNINFTNIPAGKYKYEQIDTQDGYIIDQTEYEVLIQKDGTVTFVNDTEGIIYNEKEDPQLENIAPGTIPQAGNKTEISIVALTISLLIIIYLAIKIRKDL